MALVRAAREPLQKASPLPGHARHRLADGTVFGREMRERRRLHVVSEPAVGDGGGRAMRAWAVGYRVHLVVFMDGIFLAHTWKPRSLRAGWDFAESARRPRRASGNRNSAPAPARGGGGGSSCSSAPATAPTATATSTSASHANARPRSPPLRLPFDPRSATAPTSAPAPPALTRRDYQPTTTRFQTSGAPAPKHGVSLASSIRPPAEGARRDKFVPRLFPACFRPCQETLDLQRDSIGETGCEPATARPPAGTIWLRGSGFAG